jgi:hypothetical protein
MAKRKEAIEISTLSIAERKLIHGYRQCDDDCRRIIIELSHDLVRPDESASNIIDFAESRREHGYTEAIE